MGVIIDQHQPKKKVVDDWPDFASGIRIHDGVHPDSRPTQTVHDLNCLIE